MVQCLRYVESKKRTAIKLSYIKRKFTVDWHKNGLCLPYRVLGTGMLVNACLMFHEKWFNDVALHIATTLKFFIVVDPTTTNKKECFSKTT